MATIRPHWSYSAITQYLRCPLQYFFQRVLGIPSHSIGTGLALGSAVHAGLAEYHQRLQRKEALDTEAVLKAFHECWDEKELNETIQYRDATLGRTALNRVSICWSSTSRNRPPRESSPSSNESSSRSTTARASIWRLRWLQSPT